MAAKHNVENVPDRDHRGGATAFPAPPITKGSEIANPGDAAYMGKGKPSVREPGSYPSGTKN